MGKVVVRRNLTRLSDLKARFRKETYVADVGITSESNKANSGDGASIASIATWLEYGWVQRITPKQQAYFRENHGINLKVGHTLTLPPRPFLRDTYDKKCKGWERLFTKAITKGGMNTQDALSLVAREAQDDIKETIINGGVKGKKFAPRSGMTMELYRERTSSKKTDGTGGFSTTKPLVATGKLLNSISYTITKKK